MDTSSWAEALRQAYANGFGRALLELMNRTRTQLPLPHRDKRQLGPGKGVLGTGSTVQRTFRGWDSSGFHTLLGCRTLRGSWDLVTIGL